MWQDVVLTLGSFAFIVALIPTVLSDDKPPAVTSVTTATVLIVFTAVYATLGLYLSTISSGVLSILWWAVAVQSFRKTL